MPFYALSAVAGFKSAPKAKGQKNKRYSYWHGSSDSETWAEEIDTRWMEDEDEVNEEYLGLEMEDTTSASCRTLPGIGDVLEHLLERKANQLSKRKKKVKNGSNLEEACRPCTNISSSGPAKVYGKKSTVFVGRQVDIPDNSVQNHVQGYDDEFVVVENPNMVSSSMDINNEAGQGTLNTNNEVELDVKYTSIIKLSTHSVSSNHLRKTYGSAYIESTSTPQRFAIDIGQYVDEVEGSMYVLFEAVDDGSYMQDDWRYMVKEESSNIR